MDVRLLGAVEARVGGRRLELGRRRVRALLAALASEVGEPIPHGRLIELLFADNPQDQRKALQVHVSRLRRALAPATDVRLESLAGAYVLRADRDCVDVNRFEDLVARARQTESPASRSSLLRDALALWQGPALADVSPDLLGALRDRLEELRLTAVELRVETDLELGRYEELVPELADLTRAHPTRERLVAARMMALYHAGRQVDALDVYGATAERLRDELGLDPSRELRDLQGAILREEAVAGPAVRQPAPVPARPAQLPSDLATFTGRQSELTVLAGLCEPESATAVVIDGMPGVGKTALATRLAHRVAGDYPDGQLCLDLNGSGQTAEPVSPSDALGRLLRSLGVPGAGLPAGTDERAGLYRSVLSDQRVLLLLDNAADAEQVRPLLPAASGCLAIVTSRRRLSALDDARGITLDVASETDATELFSQAAGRTAAAEDAPVVAAIVDLCGQLPLAIRLAAARLRSRPAWTAAHLLERLRDGHAGLAELDLGERSVSGAFLLSYQDLDDETRRLFRLLGLHPGPDVTSSVAAALGGVPVATADGCLEGLLDAHLMEQHTVGRYRFHDLVRQFATERAAAEDSEEVRRAALGRMYDWYLHACDHAVAIVEPTRPDIPPARTATPMPEVKDYDAAIDWLDAECRNLVAATCAASTHGWGRHGWQLARILHRYFYVRGHNDDWIVTQRLALAAARDLADGSAEAETLNNLGMAHVRTGGFVEGLEHLRDALTLSRARSDARTEAQVLNNLGIASYHAGRSADAIEHLEAALTAWRCLGDDRGRARAMNNLGKTHQRMGHDDTALDLLQQASAIRRRMGDQVGTASTLVGLGNVYADKGEMTKATDCLQRALRIERSIGHRDGQANAHLAIGQAQVWEHAYGEARRSYDQALALARGLGNRSLEAEALNGLAETDRATGAVDEALLRHRSALELVVHLGARYEQAHAHDGIGRALAALGDEAGAERHLATARDLYAEIGVPEGAYPAYVPEDA